MSFGSQLDSIQGVRAIVIGDVMLDEYIVGSISRISPEAPVMVVRKEKTNWVPGGAANVAKNIAALGGEARVLGVAGDDEGGRLLREAIDAQPGLDAQLMSEAGRVTTRKTRILANHSHQVLRVDEESNAPVSREVVDWVISKLELDSVDVVFLSDYLKGMLTPAMVQAVIELAKLAEKPVIVNAKPSSAKSFIGADLLTLNRSEATEVFGHRPESLAEGVKVAAHLRNELGVSGVLVTMGDLGMSASWAGGDVEVAAPAVEAFDVAGAGDTVLATIGLGYAKFGFDPQIFELAAQTSAKVVQHVGVAIPTASDLDSIRSLM